jgi:hypothetical protein
MFAAQSAFLSNGTNAKAPMPSSPTGQAYSSFCFLVLPPSVFLLSFGRKKRTSTNKLAFEAVAGGKQVQLGSFYVVQGGELHRSLDRKWLAVWIRVRVLQHKKYRGNGVNVMQQYYAYA